MADTDHVLMLAAIIRKVDGNHSKGAAALAWSILDHPDFHKCCNVPAPPADGEVAELVAQLTSRNYGPGALDRVAELLQRPMADLSPTAYALLTPAAELES